MPPTLPVLYSFRRCPYAIRARLAILSAGITVTVREVSLRSKPAEMLALSPKGTVPVLHLPDDAVIEQSLDIMRWALALNDPQGWLSQGDTGVGNALIERNDNTFKSLLDRYKYAERHPEKTREAWRADAVQMHIADLEERLAATPYLLGECPALADMALLPFVRQFAAVEPAWFAGQAGSAAHAPFPALKAWLDELCASPLFVAVMEKAAPRGDVEVP